MSVAILINCTPKYNNRRAVVSGRLRKRQHKKRTLGSGSGCVWLLNVCLIHFEYIHSSFFRLLFHPSDRSFFVVVWFKSSTRVKDLSERTNRRQVSWCASSIYTYSRCDDYDDVSVCVCMITSSKKIKKNFTFSTDLHRIRQQTENIFLAICTVVLVTYNHQMC